MIASKDGYRRTVVDVAELGVNAAGSTSAAMGQPGEEDVFAFQVTRQGRHIIETGGQTDVVMKLFGPNSQMSLIAEDDDGGVERHARLVAGLIPGQYVVQIRHFNTVRGTGSYSMSVKT